MKIFNKIIEIKKNKKKKIKNKKITKIKYIRFNIFLFVKKFFSKF